MKRIIRIFFFLLLLSCGLLFPEEYESLLRRGVIFLKQKMYEESLKLLEEAQKLSPENSLTYYYLGESLYCLGKTDKSIDNYRKAIEIDPTVPEYYLSLAMVYLSINKKDESLANIDKAIEIGPGTITGKKAARLKQDIASVSEGKSLVAKWVKIEEEEALKLIESAAQAAPQEGMPDETGQFPEVVKKAERLDIVKLIRKIRFETETARKMASSALKYYTQAELQQVTADMIDIASPESDRDVKRNLILALGKASTPEALELLLRILQDGKETYDMRIAALEGLSSAKTQEIVAAERTTLDSMVLNREKERKEAQKNIDETTKKIENIQTRKDELVLKNLEQQDKLNQLSMKLQEISMPTEFVDPAAPRSRVTAQEMTKLRRDIKALETSIAKQNESIVRMDEETAELQRQKLRYEGLLAKREEEKDITFQSRAPAGAIAPEETMMDAPPEMFGEPVYVETDEEKNEIIFAISLIKTLGSMRDEESLPVIKRAWDEYRVEQQRIHYLLSLARLSDFSGVDMLIARLRSDYLDGPASEEILLRAGIIEVLGDYLLQKYDDRLAGLVEYLSEEGGYPEIRKAASGVLAKIAVKPK